MKKTNANIWSRTGAEEAYRLWRANYLRPGGPSAAHCREAACRRAGSGKYVPATQTLLRRLRIEVPAAEIVRCRRVP